MLSTIFTIPSIACCKLSSPSFWIVKRCRLSKRNNVSLTWSGSTLLFVNIQKYLSLPNHSIRLCVKGERINRGVGYGQEIPAEYIFYDNEKAIQWAKRTLCNGVDGNVKKKF